MIIDSVNLEPLLKALEHFEQYRHNLSTTQETINTLTVPEETKISLLEQLEAGAIQAFEYSFELSWKTMKKLLEVRGKIANSPKETFRMAALENFIFDPEIWFTFIKKRNLTVHTYEKEEAEEVINSLPLFSEEIKKFLKNIGAGNAVN